MRRTIGASESSSIYLFGVCAGSILTLFLSLFLSKSSASFDGMTIYNWIGYALMQVGFIAVVLIYSSVRKVSLVSVTRVRPPFKPIQLVLMPFIAIATILIFLPLANLWGAFLSVIGYSGAGAAMPYYSNAGVYLLSLLLMAVLPAIGEELLMRGSVFSGLSTRNVWFGILISATLFSLMHANPLQTVHQFGLGVVLALVAVLTGSVISCVLVHFVNNFISITLAAYLPQVDMLYVKLGYYNWLTGLASIIVGVVLLVTLLYILYRLSNTGFKVVSGGIEYDEFAIYAIDDSPKSKKQSFKYAISGYFSFVGSLFTKRGWQDITRVLAVKNGVELIGKNQRMIGVWLALGLVVIYWLYAFIVGLV